MAAVRKLAMYNVYVVDVQEVIWDNEGTVKEGDYNFLYWNGNESHQLRTGALYVTE
jgi:hypothetical protein